MKAMKKIVLKIYLKNKRAALCSVELSSEDQVNDLLDDLNGNDNVIIFGQIAFTRTEFNYLTIQYK